MDAAVRYSNATFSNVCRKNGAQRGEGRSLFLFFSSSFFFFFGSLFGGFGPFSLLISLFPLFPFFFSPPFIHWFVHLKNWGAFNCSEADLARFWIDRLRFFLSFSLSVEFLSGSLDSCIGNCWKYYINSKFSLSLSLWAKRLWIKFAMNINNEGDEIRKGG